jgi:PDZ domain-containing protein
VGAANTVPSLKPLPSTPPRPIQPGNLTRSFKGATMPNIPSGVSPLIRATMTPPKDATETETSPPLPKPTPPLPKLTSPLPKLTSPLPKLTPPPPRPTPHTVASSSHGSLSSKTGTEVAALGHAGVLAADTAEEPIGENDRERGDVLCAAAAEKLADFKPKLGAEFAATDNRLGVKILRIITNGPADKAGLREGDIVSAIDRIPTTDMSLFRGVVTGDLLPGAHASLDIIRENNGTTIHKMVKVLLLLLPFVLL